MYSIESNFHSSSSTEIPNKLLFSSKRRRKVAITASLKSTSKREKKKLYKESGKFRISSTIRFERIDRCFYYFPMIFPSYVMMTEPIDPNSASMNSLT